MSSPKKNVAYEFDVSLIDSAASGSFKANPTIAAGDFKVSTDNAAFGNLTTLPSVSPAGSIVVKINLSQAEMNGDKIMIQCIDAAGGEWDDVLIFIDATVANVDDVVRSTTPANTLDVSATGEAGLDLDNTSGTLGAAQIAASALDGKGDWNIGKTGYALSQAFPSNFSALGIESDGDVTKCNLVATTTTNSDMRGTDGAIKTTITSTTTAAGSTTTLIDSAQGQVSAYWPGSAIRITSGANIGLTRLIIQFVNASNIFTVSPRFPSAVDSGVTYEILPWGSVNVGGWAATHSLIVEPNALSSGAVDANIQSINDAEVVGDGNATPWDGI